MKGLYLLLILGLFTHGSVYAQEVRKIYLNDTQVATVNVLLRGTVLSLPTKPSKVILGSAGSFGIEYVENDLAISPLRANARSNLFVYMYGRRFAFDLKASSSGGSSIVVVRDEIEAPPRGKTHGKK